MFRGILLVSLVMLISLTASMQNSQRIAEGVWGGQHIHIVVGEKSATIEYDCASGVIDGPLVIDGHGSFKLQGKHCVQRGGPIRADEKPRELPATYTGSIKGDVMTLTLKVGDWEPETFTLRKGKEGELVRCK